MAAVWQPFEVIELFTPFLEETEPKILLLRATLRYGFDVSNIDLFLLSRSAGLAGPICALRFGCSTQFHTLSHVLGDVFVAVQAIGCAVLRSQSVIIFRAADAAFKQLL